MAGQFCTNPRNGQTKVKYKKRQQALAHAAKTTSLHDDRTISVYKCCWCRTFHLTSREQEAKIETPPSAAKLRRKLAAYGAEIQASLNRLTAAEKDYMEELAYIRRETERIFAGRTK